MKKYFQFFFIYTFIFLFSISFLSAQVYENSKKKSKDEPGLESLVKQYWFVMLTKGANRTQDSATAARIQAGHLANINRLYYSGKLKVAGPFGDDGNWMGIFIFDCETKEEVEKLLLTDPAIESGRLEFDIRPWWTAATGSFRSGIPTKLN